MQEKQKNRWRTVIGAIVIASLLISVIYSMIQMILSPEEERGHSMVIMLECLAGIVLVILPGILDRKWSFGIPNYMYITYFIFIYCAIYLGSARGFYSLIPHWDTILHAISGAMLGALGFSLVTVCNDSKRVPIHLSPFFVSLFAFSFALAVGAIWEIYEYTGDGLLGMNMHRFSLSNGTPLVGRDALYDTMKDVIIDAISALAVAIIGYFPTRRNYLKAKKKEIKVNEDVVRKILCHSDKLMVCEIQIKKGNVTPLHTHPHEQSTYVISGSCIGRLGDKEQILQPGDAMLAPGDEPHGLTALEDAVVLDIFTPERKDFLEVKV